MSNPRLESKRVLIVDDDEDILGSIDLVMRAEGAETTTVTDGNAAVSFIHSTRPDVVVLDMMLPKRSGFLVLEKIKSEPDAPVIVMITANQGKRHMAYAKTLGVDAYLTKPVSLQRLVDTVVELLDRPPGGDQERAAAG
ncbi:MAG: response regulator [Phycisphaerales bacterium]|nr:response regulator [Phycisphaerae bacterium]NNF41736.1 response regulator [Phycisphaerales bacterium]NNM25676.1 response regulator [Phycisphaerales bacterium]